MRTGSCLVLYGTETGNAQDVADELGRLVERLHFSSRVTEFDSIGLKELLQHDLVFFVISTTGQGDLPANARRFWRLLRSVKLQPGSLRQLRFVSFGLGDSSYPQFNYAHRKLYNRLVQLGAVALCERGESDEQHPEGIDGAFVPWSLELKQRLLELFPLPAGVEPIGDDVPSPPKWTLAVAPDQSEALSVPSGNGGDGTDRSELPSFDLLPVADSIHVTLKSNDRVTPTTHWQDVRHLAFTAHELYEYLPGDILSIFPKNFPTDVQTFIDLYGWANVADTPLQVLSNDSNNDASVHSPLRHLSLTDIRLTIRYLLTNVLDIMSIPRRSFFSRVAHYTTDEFQRERLLEFTNPEYIDELYDYTTRPRRSILEVLQEFDTVKIPWQHLLDILPLMRGRQFSIASGGQLKVDTAGQGTRFELLIAIVKYRTVIKRLRQGVCTRYIASLAAGQQLNVKLTRGGLNTTERDIDKPVVMIGPGTGVAPMRSLIYERLAWRMRQSPDNTTGSHAGDDDSPNRPAEPAEQAPAHDANDVLFFGCRNEVSDYFFRAEWAELQRQGALDVHAAFSRDDGSRKVYVQDVLRHQARAVHERLRRRRGIVYVCGSSGRMPRAVREALVEIFQAEGGIERDAAEAELVRMEREGRYKQETW